MPNRKFQIEALSFLLLFFSPLYAAASSLSFAPPPGDVSVIFLGNIFGIVDGVLHGSGSQIMGNMFAVFNAAVLALGGIIIMYTLIVGTMNTAQEGEMLGHKWSSIWIPVRATMGLALLIPKASGYCLIQIFVMWVVVQGVGAADKVWDAALSYLNRGGVIVHSQIAPLASITADNSGIASGASAILTGQVCMMGLQKQLENQRQGYQNAKEKDAGPCSGKPSKQMAKFCNDAVPDFVNTVNILSYQSQNIGATKFTLPMPHFDSGSDYVSLNGICGSIGWNAMGAIEMGKISAYMPTLSTAEVSTTAMSRAIALQQMYMDLSTIARSIVNNDPQLSNETSSGTNTSFSPVANDQFGVPYLTSGVPCDDTNPNCTRWNGDLTSPGAPLFNGTEFQGAVTDYNAIMLPTLNLIVQATKDSNAASARKFINDAETQGWALAGSYFFDLVKLNGLADTPSLTDSGSGLERSNYNVETMLSAYGSDGSCSGDYALLCFMFNKDSTPVNRVISLINGLGLLPDPLSPPTDLSPEGGNHVKTGIASSTVYGFINNEAMIYLPGQAGMKTPHFKINVNIKPSGMMLKFPKMNMRCIGTIGPFHCVVTRIMSGLYDLVFLPIMNIFMDQLEKLFEYVILNFLSIPLMVISGIFERGMAIIERPGVNPILALAQMGTYYINYSMKMWMDLLAMSTIFGWVPGYGIVLSLIEPLLFSWLAIMVGIGYTTAYYVPFLPYMIFTFGVIAWLIAVIEAMVAAPIVALGITHPEGEGALGKGEQAIMILMNVFLRPAMMIIGYIAGIALSYVSVWLINAGFGHLTNYMQSDEGRDALGYTSWASMYAGFFSMLIYTMLYLTVVQKAFTLIYVLPDKVLRWIGGQPESFGQDIAQWSEETKGQVKEGGQDVAKQAANVASKQKGYYDQAKGEIGKMMKGPSKIGGGGA